MKKVLEITEEVINDMSEWILEKERVSFGQGYIVGATATFFIMVFILFLIK